MIARAEHSTPPRRYADGQRQRPLFVGMAYTIVPGTVRAPVAYRRIVARRATTIGGSAYGRHL